MRAFLGMGLLGSNFVLKLLENGEQVQVWNRTPAKAKILEKDGAKAFETPSEAVKNADLIHLTLKDDVSVDEVLEMAFPGLKPGAVIADHTTTSAAGAIQRTEAWAKKGIKYQHAPVLMGPSDARKSTGVMLVSGDQDLVEQLTPALSPMTGKLLNCGGPVGKAASMKLTSNLFLIALNGGIGDMLSLAKSYGISTDELLDLFGIWNPGSALSGRLKKLEEGDFTHPSWELRMARKDARLMVEATRAVGVKLTVIPAVAAEMDRLIADGFGQQDWSIIGKEAMGRGRK
ncbi:MAG: NAD(P)-dependent oxidoreductase [Chitinophagaceae bacterium]|nr:NAD(P)-dependent oxidoreductase [Chitinophagaceae bacterium]